MISRPAKDHNFPTRKSSGSLEVVVVSKTRLCEQSSSTSSNYSQPGRYYGCDGRSALKSRRARSGHKRLSNVWSGWLWILVGKWSAECRRCHQTRRRYTLFSFNFQRFWDGLNCWKPESDWRRARQGELSSSTSNNSSLWETNPTPVLMRRSPFGTRIENVPLFVYINLL